jgi:putative acetyltransferase
MAARMTAEGPRIARESPDQPDVVALIEELDAYQKPLYPAESHHGVDIATLLRPEVVFVVARDAQGRAVGCGGVMVTPEYGELKRMYVRPECRGQGIARSLFEALQSAALERGCRRLTLETGIRQPEALALYERLGFVRCKPFGDYWDDPMSVFMDKRIS